MLRNAFSHSAAVVIASGPRDDGDYNDDRGVNWPDPDGQGGGGDARGLG